MCDEGRLSLTLSGWGLASLLKDCSTEVVPVPVPPTANRWNSFNQMSVFHFDRLTFYAARKCAISPVWRGAGWRPDPVSLHSCWATWCSWRGRLRPRWGWLKASGWWWTTAPTARSRSTTSTSTSWGGARCPGPPANGPVPPPEPSPRSKSLSAGSCPVLCGWVWNGSERLEWWKATAHVQ